MMTDYYYGEQDVLRAHEAYYVQQELRAYPEQSLAQTLDGADVPPAHYEEGALLLAEAALFVSAWFTGEPEGQLIDEHGTRGFERSDYAAFDSPVIAVGSWAMGRLGDPPVVLKRLAALRRKARPWPNAQGGAGQ